MPSSRTTRQRSQPSLDVWISSAMKHVISSQTTLMHFHTRLPPSHLHRCATRLFACHFEHLNTSLCLLTDLSCPLSYLATPPGQPITTTGLSVRHAASQHQHHWPVCQTRSYNQNINTTGLFVRHAASAASQHQHHWPACQTCRTQQYAPPSLAGSV